MSLGEQVADDYRALRLSLKAHPMTLVREQLDAETTINGTTIRISQCQSTAADLWAAKDSDWVRLTGVVLVRQRPGSASGVIFISLEDETGVANLVVWPSVFEQFRREILGASLIQVDGRVQKVGSGEHQVIHLVAKSIVDRTQLLADMQVDQDGEQAHKTIETLDVQLAHADEVSRPIPDERASQSLPIRDQRPHRDSLASTKVGSKASAPTSNAQPVYHASTARHPRDTQIRFPVRHANSMTSVGQPELVRAIAPARGGRPPADIEKKRDQKRLAQTQNLNIETATKP